MKSFLTLSMLVVVTLSQVRSEEIPNLRGLSILDERWTVIEEAKSKPSSKLQFSQIVYDSEDGERVSLQLQRVKGALNPTFHQGGPWSEAIIHTFPSGHPNAKEPVRCVTGSIEFKQLTDETPALAFTTYWCREDHRVAISHGYSMAVGPFRVLLQHTSESVITPEFVWDVALSLVEEICEHYGVEQPARPVESKVEGKQNTQPELDVRPE